jgi:alpha-galactosidase
VTGWQTLEEVPVDPERGRVYLEGWQSWSPAGWHAAAALGPAGGLRPEHAWQHAMRFRPGVALPDDGAQAEGVLVVDPGGGAPARWYASLEAADVASMRAQNVDGRVVVAADRPVTVGSEADGGEAALEVVGARLAELAAPPRPVPTVWCSWYHYFEDVTAADIAENAAAIRRADIPVDVIQIDDGWSTGLGDGLRPSPGFTSLPDLVARLRDDGFGVGLWLAPFTVGADTELARGRPDWLVGDAGHNWGQPLRGLDLTHPGVLEHLRERGAWLRNLGISYAKLDFLYAGAVPGRRWGDTKPELAYRDGLAALREGLGPDVYVLGCGAPLLPSLGLVDAMRVSPDTFHEGGEDGSTGLRGLLSLTARTWQHGRLWTNDPDCLVARPGYLLREEWARAFEEFGALRSCSDRIADLDGWGLDTTRRLMAAPAPTSPLPRSTVTEAAAVNAQLVAAALTGTASGGRPS